MSRNHKRRYLLLLAFLVLSLTIPDALYAQAQAGHAGPVGNSWFGLLEIPFLFLCVFFAFLTANALKGGVFGRGMKLLAWGFLVMAVGHLHMLVAHFTGYNLFDNLFGSLMGSVVWILALTLTWGLSGFAFYQIYRASKVR